MTTREFVEIDIEIARGFTEAERAEAAALYWLAFQAKFRHALGEAEAGEAFFRRIMNPAFAFAAREDGRLVALAGIRTRAGALLDGRRADLAEMFGPAGGLWRAALLRPLIRPLHPRRLLMDGIAVLPEARGRGVGAALLGAVVAAARAEGLEAVRLDVVRENPRARALYEREGFRATGTIPAGRAGRLLYGFSAVTTMIRPV